MYTSGFVVCVLIQVLCITYNLATKEMMAILWLLAATAALRLAFYLLALAAEYAISTFKFLGVVELILFVVFLIMSLITGIAKRKCKSITQ